MSKSKRYGLLTRLWKNILHSRLKALEGGMITFVEGDQRKSFGAADDLEAEIRVHDPRFYRRSLLGGGVGFAEGFMLGWWSTDDLTALVLIFALD